MTTTHRLRLGQRRVEAGYLLSALVILGAFAAAQASGSGDTALVGAVEDLSFGSGSFLQQAGALLPFGYAYVLGMVAAVNPCGFALLPVYLGFYLGDGAHAGSGRSRGTLLRAAQVSFMVTAGFIVLFGVMGLALSVATTAIAGYFPLLGLLVGVALVLAGGRLVGGGILAAGLGNRLVSQLGDTTRQVGNRGFLAYGVAYGAASLGCTLPLFMAAVVFPITRGGFGAGAFQFVLYALGMGSVITLLTLSTAIFKRTALRRLRTIGSWVNSLSPVLLLLAGAYVIYYWLTQGGLLDRLG
ncbi:MAG: cytochrome c biogenesis protein CcdA [Chloroflexota bacterium]|nr:cytochrome c biogenesis protein CcdA [Chloroflexota bacterium]